MVFTFVSTGIKDKRKEVENQEESKRNVYIDGDSGQCAQEP